MARMTGATNGTMGGRSPAGGSGFPICRACGRGELVPLSDYGGQGSAVQYKAWVCTEPDCGFNLKVRNGDVFVNEPVYDYDVAGQRRARPSHAPQLAAAHAMR
jgi:hypothetical protein